MDDAKRRSWSNEELWDLLMNYTPNHDNRELIERLRRRGQGPSSRFSIAAKLVPELRTTKARSAGRAAAALKAFEAEGLLPPGMALDTSHVAGEGWLGGSAQQLAAAETRAVPAVPRDRADTDVALETILEAFDHVYARIDALEKREDATRLLAGEHTTALSELTTVLRLLKTDHVNLANAVSKMAPREEPNAERDDPPALSRPPSEPMAGTGTDLRSRLGLGPKP